MSALTSKAVELLRTKPVVRETLRRTAFRIGYDAHDWVRSVMYRECFDFIRSLEPSSLEVMEISAGPQWSREFNFASYEPTHYPDFDICTQVLPRTFDLIIADQVFEHLKWPYKAATNVRRMLNPGGYFVVATPFLLRVHDAPIDCSRWTETGLRYFLQEAGFQDDFIKTGSWGNKACLIANLVHWKKRGFTGSLKNDPRFPVMVWAFAQNVADHW